MNHDDLVQQLRDGHEYAGPFLVSMLGPELLGYARAVASDLSDADREAIVELAIEKAVLKIDRYEPEKGTFPGWARGFVRNEVGNWRRTNQNMLGLDEPDRFEDADPPTRRERDVDLLVNRVQQAVSELTPTDQLILQLRDYEQLSYEEIAMRLDVRPDACRQRHRRALMRLGQILQDDPAVSDQLRGGES